MTIAERIARERLQQSKLDLRLLELGEKVVGRRAIEEIKCRHEVRRQRERGQPMRPVLHHHMSGSWVRVVD